MTQQNVSNKAPFYPISWLKVGVVSLAISGLYSIIIVLLRVPQLNWLLPKTLFKPALVVHVNLSVLAWLLCLVATIWQYARHPDDVSHMLPKTSLIAILIMTISPFLDGGEAIMSNYVPMIDNVWFILGLSIFATSIFLLAVSAACSCLKDWQSTQMPGLIKDFIITSSLIAVLSFVTIYMALNSLSKISSKVELDLDYFYEMLFWGGGHILQFLYTQILMLSSLVLLEVIYPRLTMWSVYRFFMWLNFAFSTLAILAFIRYDLTYGDYKIFFTKHMIYFGGIAPTLLLFTLLYDCRQGLRHFKISSLNFAGISLFCSAIMFAFGGIIGLLISGINVKIPAHYHGSIVGISVSLMGFAYLYCFKSSLTTLQKTKLASYLLQNAPQFSASYFRLAGRQIYIITIGQILHISGLALAGGYGALRKNPDGSTTSEAKFYMGIMGLGGLIAIIGGLIFVYIFLRKFNEEAKNGKMA